MVERYIVHVDMDAFYASIEQRDHPDYRNKPVIVGADPKGGRGRGVVAACSYEARKFGIHSALPISAAFRKCPRGIFLQPDMKKYVRESKRILGILNRFSPEVEPISIDEAFLDISRSHHLFGTPEDTCRSIKLVIKEETGLTASVGMAPIKMAAKIASDLKKPDGLVIIPGEKLLDFLHPLAVEKLWGIGQKTFRDLQNHGIHSIGDLARQDYHSITGRFGKHGEHMWKLANGIDPRAVTQDTVVKSVGHEHTFETDTGETRLLLDTLMQLSEKVSRRLRKNHFKGRTITLKIRFADFSTFTRSKTLEKPTNFSEEIYDTAVRRLKAFDLKKRLVRLIGIQVSNIEENPFQSTLFKEDPAQEKRERLHQAVDKIKDLFGEKAIKHRG